MTKLPKSNEIGKRLREHLSNIGRDHIEFAKSINEKPSHIACLLKGKEQLVPQKTKRRIWHILGDHGWQITETYNFKVVQDMCRLTKENAMLMAIVGAPGLGKTSSLEYFNKSNARVIYVTYEISMRPRDLFIAILKKMGVVYEKPLHATILKVVEELSRWKNPLIIIDECDKMPYKTFQYLHILRNKTMNMCGILMSGVTEMKLMLQRQASRKSQGIAEFMSRVQHWEELTMPLRSEIKAVCEHNDITDPEFVKELCKSINYRELYNKVQVNNLQTAEL